MDGFDAVAPWWRRRRTVVAFGLLVGLVWWFALRTPAPVWVPGATVDASPYQEESDRDPWKMEDGTQVSPLAEYRVDARVLGRKDYSDVGAFLSPMDLALGWGTMSDQAVIDQLKIRQSGRWYHYSWPSSPPIPVGDIIRQSANTHLIPANQTVAAALDEIQEGDRVRLEGVLVAVQRPDGWRWRSSLSRKDSGDGSCELLWVESVEKLNMAGVAVDGKASRR